MLGTELDEKYAHFGVENFKDLGPASPGRGWWWWWMDEGGEALNTLGVGRVDPRPECGDQAEVSSLPPSPSLPVPQDLVASDFSRCPPSHTSWCAPPVHPSSQGGRIWGRPDTRGAAGPGFAARNGKFYGPGPEVWILSNAAVRACSQGG